MDLRPHPRSTGFEWQRAATTPRRFSAAQVEQYHRAGYVLVEDILDTGLTLHYLLQTFRARGVGSIRIATLLSKPARRVIEVEADYVGFEIPDEFVVGYGLDYDERYRNLPFIGVLGNPEPTST